MNDEKDLLPETDSKEHPEDEDFYSDLPLVMSADETDAMEESEAPAAISQDVMDVEDAAEADNDGSIMDEVEAIEEVDDLTETDLEIEAELPLIPDDDLDIDAALAAVANLNEIAAAADAEQQQMDLAEAADDEIQPLPDEELDPAEPSDDEIEEPEMPQFVHSTFDRPPMMKLERGQAASVIPAFLLIGIGTWLTFTLTISDAALNPLILPVLIVIGIGVMTLSQWVTSSRWSAGSFFVGTLTLLSGAVLFFLLQADGLNISTGWTLLIAAPGIALFLTALLAKESPPHLSVIALMLIVAGLVGLVVTTGNLVAPLLETLRVLSPVVILLLVIVLLLPAIRRRRG